MRIDFCELEKLSIEESVNIDELWADAFEQGFRLYFTTGEVIELS